MNIDTAVTELVREDRVRIPPQPATALRLAQVVSKADFGLDEVVKALHADQAFAANLLRLANSPYYARGSVLTSLPGAVARVGAKELHRYAVASWLAQVATGAGPLFALRRRVWQEAFSSALVSEQLALLEGDDPEECFVAGLLHDVGKLVALGAIEQVLPRVVTPKPVEFWWSKVERFHLEMGALLAKRWQLPQALVEVISEHHQTTAKGRAGLVARADQIVALLSSRPHVSVEQVEAVCRVSAARAVTLAEKICLIPEMLKAFDNGAAGNEVESAVLHPEEPVAPMALPAFPVELVGPRGSIKGEVLSLDSRLMRVKVAQPMSDNQMLEAKLSLEPPLKFWVAVRGCTAATDGTHSVQLFPFALGNSLLNEWQRLVEQATTPKQAA